MFVASRVRRSHYLSSAVTCTYGTISILTRHAPPNTVRMSISMAACIFPRRLAATKSDQNKHRSNSHTLQKKACSIDDADAARTTREHGLQEDSENTGRGEQERPRRGSRRYSRVCRGAVVLRGRACRTECSIDALCSRACTHSM
jgi:hypothetical protein